MADGTCEGKPAMRRVLIAVAAVMLLIASFATLTADASGSLTTRLGTHGAAKLTTGGPNQLYLNVKGLTDGKWAEALYAGTCARLGTKIVSLLPRSSSTQASRSVRTR